MSTLNQLLRINLRDLSPSSCRALRRITLACIALLLGPLLTLAQSDKQTWVQRFGTTFGSKDLARGIATDSAGNTVVAGDSDEGGLGLGILVIKYSPAGDALWTNRCKIAGEDKTVGVALDGSGNVFVSGSSGSQFVMLAYSSLGVPLWTNLFNGSAGSSYTERPSAPAVDSSGNVFITGPASVGGSVAIATLKYSSAGMPLWTNIFVTGSVGYLASSLAVDHAGNVVAIGGKRIIKYDGNGVPLWTNVCPGAAFLLDLKQSLIVDGSGDVLFLGQLDGAGSFFNNLIVKYSSDGLLLWTNRYPGYGQSLAVDPANNAAVTGSLWPAGSYGTLGTIKYSAGGVPVWTNQYDLVNQTTLFCTAAADGNGDIFVSAYGFQSVNQTILKYSAAGSLLWIQQAHIGVQDDEDYPRPHPALAIDPSGNALVTGYFFNDYTTDFRVRKYDTDGTEVWARFYDGSVSVFDSPSAVAVDLSGNIIVTGDGRHDYATIKYSPSGTALWTNYYDGPAHVSDWATALSISSNGNIFVTGRSYPGDYEDVTTFWLTLAYTADGVPLWTNACPNFEAPVAIATDYNGNVIVSGDRERFWGEGGWATIKYSGAGVPLWTNLHVGTDPDSDNPRGYVHGLAVDGNSDVVVVGSSYPYFATIKYSSSGTALWTNRYGSDVGYASANAVAIGTNGDIFVTGFAANTNNYVWRYDFVTIKYSAGGVPLWTNLYDGPAMLSDSATALALDGSGNVLVTGYSASTNDGGDFVTIKYSSDGTALWTNRYAGPLNQWDMPRALGVDRSGNVFVTGGSSDGSYSTNAVSVSIAYSSGGIPLWTNIYYGAQSFPSGIADSDLAVVGVGEMVVAAQSFGDYATIKYESGFALDIATTPTNQTVQVGTTATFSVGVSGTAPFTFQWLRNGTNLSNGGNISGATTANLALNPVMPSDAGSYTVVISNPGGSVTSMVAVLSVPVFENVTDMVAPGLPQVWVSSMTWADYDNDGRLDFLMTSSDSFRSQVWRNTGNGFTNVTDEVAPGLPGSTDSVKWVDYDNDGLLDFLMTGQPQPDSDMPIARVWRNIGGKFTDVTAAVAPGLRGVDGAAAWGDYDNDGRLDLLLAGGTDNGDAGYDIISQLWRNTEQGFTNVTASILPGLPPMYPASVAWADYDNDGRLDFIITGQTNRGFFSAVSQLWRNTGSGFTNVTASVAPGLPDVAGRSVAWGDYDSDGRLDFIITGQTNWGASNAVSQLWRNTENGFTNVTASVVPGLPQVMASSVAWGDYDNDGRLDLLIAGQLWRNTGSGFTNVTDSVLPSLPQDGDSFVAWGDYDNDGRLDLLIGGHPNNGAGGYCQLWRNDTPITNTPPSAPTGLAMTASSNAVMLSWNSATDDQTPASGLTYNVRAGTTPGGNNLLSAHVSATNGFRRVPAMGNAMLRHSLRLTGLTNGETIYWSVQAVDSAFAGGPFATETNVVSVPPVFSNVTATLAPGLDGLNESSVTWADYDNDGRLDFLVTGRFTDFSAEDGERNEYFVSQLWRNTGTGFTNVTATVAPGLPGVYAGSAAWGDYDNDGRLDLFLTGVVTEPVVGNDDGISQIWRNTGSGFVNVTATVAPGLLGIGDGSVAWGDYDNDGRLDFVITGFTTQDDRRGLSEVWRNTGSGFTNVTFTVVPGLPEVYHSSVAWGDYDNDGRLDFILADQLWRNTGSAFVDVTATAALGLTGGPVAWGDYDNDGWLDFIVGNQLWRNTGSGFTNVTVTVAPGLQETDFNWAAWGDYDNDGRLDLLLTGTSSQLWRNTGAGFSNVTATIAVGLLGADSAAWGDYDNDGRLDFFLAGDPHQILWNNTTITNTPPTAPTGLAMTTSSNAVMLSWNSATDDRTPASGLTYNVRAGTTPGGNDLLSAHVNATNGFRRVPAMGNAMLCHSLPLTGLMNGQTVYWSVQAVDTSFAGGPFATETSVVSLPQLRIAKSGATNSVLSWTPPTFGWVLQQSPDLTPPVIWSDVTNPRVVVGGKFIITNSSSARFFRLSKP